MNAAPHYRPGTGERTYSSRSAAVRAARNACKRMLGPSFCAYEGPDYEIHPDGADSMFNPDRFYFRLRGPAAITDCPHDEAWRQSGGYCGACGRRAMEN